VGRSWKGKEGVGDVSETIEFDKKNFYILDAQRLFKKDCFDFTIQTVGVYDNEKILKIACDVIIARCKKNRESGGDRPVADIAGRNHYTELLRYRAGRRGLHYR
jgi:hypothetical protein